MTGTNFGQVFDEFQMLTADYRLTMLFNQSQTDFATYLSGWLIFAIRDFTPICSQDLSYDISSQTFTSTLTDQNITILAQLMEKWWMEKNINDIEQMNLHVLDKDFRVFSESQNLTAKKERLSQLKEELSQLLVDYRIQTNPWTNWYNGQFWPIP